ncbi:MAG: hypothetical protein APU95_00400 [Hadesarchaea archaeon YNP_N21]|jgi:phosphate uptake regulator|nr:MAG: hypothetical protein APU95_00400 [Hadesarchaea archaeon YNP_N21]
MTNEEIRKVQVTGKSTYIVSLPKAWVNEMRIKPGDSVVVKKQEDSTLLISPMGIKKPEKLGEVKVKINPQENPNTIVRKVVSLYLVGYNVIRLVSTGDRIAPSQRDLIKDFVRKKLIGTEITADSLNELTLQVLLSYPELPIRNALRRMFLISSSMQKDAIVALEKFDQDLARDVIQMDDEVDRFSMYIIRQLKSAVGDPRLIREIGLETARDCLGYRLISKSVERIADHSVLIAKKVLQLKRHAEPLFLKKVNAMSSFANSLFENAIDSLFKMDYKMAEEVIEKVAMIEQLENEAIQSMLEKGNREDIANLRLVIESLRRIAEYSGDIAEIVLNLTINRAIKE